MPQCTMLSRLHARADAGLHQQIGGPMLDQAGANAILDVVAAAIFDDDRLNALQMQQAGEHQTCGPRPDNADLRPHEAFPGDQCSL